MPNSLNLRNSASYISAALTHHSSAAQTAKEQRFKNVMNEFGQFIFDGGSTLLRIFLFLNLLEVITAQSHFGFSYNDTHYELEAYSNNLLLKKALFQNPCGQIEPSFGTHDQIAGFLADKFKLYRQNNSTQLEFENCLMNFLTTILNDSDKMGLQFMIGVGALSILFLVGMLVAKLGRRCQLRITQAPENHLSHDLEQAITDIEPSIPPIIISANALVSKSCAERLEDINFPDADIPRQFICPISQSIMTDPVIAIDGNSYERKLIEKIKAMGGHCPLNRSVKVDVLIPNNGLKSQILEFVEEQEEEFNKPVNESKLRVSQ